jgi:phosphate transport system substrate-binding protein
MNTVLGIFSTLALVLACSAAPAEEMLNGAGATFPAPLYTAWAYDYTKESGVKINYQSIGSGGGVRQIIERTVDFGASDDPMTPEDLSRDNLIQFPAVIGGVVPVVNIQGIQEGELKLDSKALCMIYLGDTRYWDDPLIKTMNPRLNLPHSAIIVVHRSDGSGTTAIYTTYLSETCAGWSDKVGKGKSVKWPIGIGGRGNEGVANYVRQTPNAIGYVEFAYARQNRLAHAQLKNKAGEFVSPSSETFADAAEAGDFDPKRDFFAWLTNTPGKNSWPISGASFILLAKEKKDANVKVARFFDLAFKNGDGKAKELTYVPLPRSLKDKIRAYWKAAGIQ